MRSFHASTDRGIDFPSIKTLSKEETLDLFRRWRVDGEDHRDAIVEGNIPLVLHLVKRCARDGDPPFGDLFGEAVLGLFEAVDRFDVAKGVAFSFYLSIWVRRHMQICRCSYKLCPVPPKYTPVSKHAKDRDAYAMAPRVLPLTDVADDRGEGMDSIEPADPSKPEAECEAGAKEARSFAAMTLDLLAPDEQMLLALRLGLRGHRPHTLGELGGKLGCSAERTRQRVNKALDRARVLVSWNKEIFADVI